MEIIQHSFANVTNRYRQNECVHFGPEFMKGLSKSECVWERENLLCAKSEAAILLME